MDFWWVATPVKLRLSEGNHYGALLRCSLMEVWPLSLYCYVCQMLTDGGAFPPPPMIATSVEVVLFSVPAVAAGQPLKEERVFFFTA